MAISPYYASLIKSFDMNDPIFQMCFPQYAELIESDVMMSDPLHEEQHMPIPGMIHRYANRVLIIATTMCAMYCRHCTRKRLAGQREVNISDSRLQRIVQYISEHKEINDIIISGGDPLTLDDDRLESILSQLRSIPHVDIIRFGSRTPVTLPMRITPELVSMLKKYHPIYLNTHFNHPVEVTADSKQACQMLADAGVALGNQSVLLRNVNNDHNILIELYRLLLKSRVRPYYLYQCDLVRGVNHFITSLEEGRSIIKKMYGKASGLAIPTYIIDLPDGGGKIPVTPNWSECTAENGILSFTNFEGKTVLYPTNEPLPNGVPHEDCFSL